MSIVERLAAKYRAEYAMLVADDELEPEERIVIPATQNDARWWMRAIADELEVVDANVDYSRACLKTSAQWLRESAQDSEKPK